MQGYILRIITIIIKQVQGNVGSQDSSGLEVDEIERKIIS